MTIVRRVVAGFVGVVLATSAASCGLIGGGKDSSTVSPESFTGAPEGTRLVTVTRTSRHTKDKETRVKKSHVNFLNADPAKSIRVPVFGRTWIGSSVSGSNTAWLSEKHVHYFGNKHHTFPRPKEPEHREPGAFEAIKDGTEFVLSYGSPHKQLGGSGSVVTTDLSGKIIKEETIPSLQTYSSRCGDNVYVMAGELHAVSGEPRQMTYMRTDLTTVRSSGQTPDGAKTLTPVDTIAPCSEGKAYTLFRYAADQSLTSAEDKFVYGLGIMDLENNKYEYKPLTLADGTPLTTHRTPGAIESQHQTKANSTQIYNNRLWFLFNSSVYSTKLDGTDGQLHVSAELADGDHHLLALKHGKLYVLRQKRVPDPKPVFLDVYGAQSKKKIEDGTEFPSITGHLHPLGDLVVLEGS